MGSDPKDVEDEWQRAQRAGREASRAALRRRIRLGLPIALAIGVGAAIPAYVSYRDGVRKTEEKAALDAEVARMAAEAGPPSPPPPGLPPGSACKAFNACEDGVCVEELCRQLCEKGQACPGGTVCRTVDLEFSLAEGAGKRSDKRVVDRGFRLCVPGGK
jgi:hypothetical protein